MRTCLSRVGTLTLHRIPSTRETGYRSYTQVSQLLYKLEQATAAPVQRKSGGWVIPAALAVIGLGLSTFSTKKMVSSNSPIKMLSSSTSTTTKSS